jgi:serine/threonine protein kinase
VLVESVIWLFVLQDDDNYTGVSLGNRNFCMPTDTCACPAQAQVSDIGANAPLWSNRDVVLQEWKMDSSTSIEMRKPASRSKDLRIVDMHVSDIGVGPTDGHPCVPALHPVHVTSWTAPSRQSSRIVYQRRDPRCATDSLVPLSSQQWENSAAPWQRSALARLPLGSSCKPIIIHHYHFVQPLQSALFRQVVLAYDTLRQCHVVIKVSLLEFGIPAPPPQAGIMTPQSGSASRSVSILEDVSREARIHLVLTTSQSSMTTTTIDPVTCGLSKLLIAAINAPENAMVKPDEENPVSLQQQFLNSIRKGQKFIASVYSEFDNAGFHYLISEYAAHGDLHTVLASCPGNSVSEEMARHWFYQICCSVRYMHAKSIAHLDISLENVCLTNNNSIRLIDFGIAAQHPSYSRKLQVGGTSQRNTAPQIRLVNETPFSSSCECNSCKMSMEMLLDQDPAIQACLHAGSSLSQLKFLCRPICKQFHNPGKRSYMSCELFHDHCWDAFANDVFGLGVLLYILVTGRPPFSVPDESSDIWFHVIYSGHWLQPQIRSQSVASVYDCLSPNLLDLINSILKPQHQRPTIDGLMRHPWFQGKHNGNVVLDRTSQHPTAQTRPDVGNSVGSAESL